MKTWLNKAEIALNHGDRRAKSEFVFWMLCQKCVVTMFMYAYAMVNNWPLHYLRTLVSDTLLKKPKVTKI